MNLCECLKVAPGPRKPKPDKTLSKGWNSGSHYLKPQIYVEKPPNASVPLTINFRRGRVGEDTQQKTVQYSDENENIGMNASTRRNKKSLKDERKKIKQNQQEFFKAYKERFGRQTPLDRITPNPLKSKPSYNHVDTSSKQPIPYDSAEKRRIRQQQIDFIREYERKALEEKLPFEDIEQQNRIRQEQLDFIKEYDRKLEERYEESLIQEQVKFMQKLKEEEAARRAAELRSTATGADSSHTRRVGYNRLAYEDLMKKEKESPMESMSNCMYRCCCKLYTFVTVLFVIGVVVFFYG